MEDWNLTLLSHDTMSRTASKDRLLKKKSAFRAYFYGALLVKGEFKNETATCQHPTKDVQTKI